MRTTVVTKTRVVVASYTVELLATELNSLVSVLEGYAASRLNLTTGTLDTERFAASLCRSLVDARQSGETLDNL